jgi:hypothetical protein
MHERCHRLIENINLDLHPQEEFEFSQNSAFSEVIARYNQ